MLLLVQLVWASGLPQVESAIAAAERAPSPATTLEAVTAATELHAREPSLEHRLLEIRALVLHYPYDSGSFSYARYADGVDALVKPLRKHPALPGAVCGLRDILHTEGRAGAADYLESLSRRARARCGSRKLVPRYASVAPPTLLGATTPPLADSREPAVDLATAESQAAALSKVARQARRADAPDDALGALAETIGASSPRRGCENAAVPAETRIEACTPWLERHADDVQALFFVARAHIELAESGVDVEVHANAALARLRAVLEQVAPADRPAVEAAIERTNALVP